MKVRIAILTLSGALALAAGPALAGNVTGKVTAAHAKTPADIVVYIDKAPGQFAPPEQHPVMDQKNLTFVPHVLPVVAGTTVDFLNSDKVLHNVYSPDKCVSKFNLGTWPQGQKRSQKFDHVGCAPVLLCAVHPEMEAYVVVLQNPYSAVTDKTGKYTIANVPEGKYTLKVWNKKTVDLSKQVAVPKDGDVTCDMALK
jgi:plastocyanin